MNIDNLILIKVQQDTRKYTFSVGQSWIKVTQIFNQLIVPKITNT